jgi:hypothetical protein
MKGIDEPVPPPGLVTTVQGPAATIVATVLALVLAATVNMEPLDALAGAPVNERVGTARIAVVLCVAVALA